MSKVLVAFFSASGVTRRAAERIARQQGAELFEIRPAQPYTKADLDWTDTKSRCYVEMHSESSRPAVAEKVTDMAAYDKIYVGFPIWWGVAPRIINTFLESYDFNGKTIQPFATSGGSGYGNAGANIKTSAAGAKVLPGEIVK